MLRKSFDHTSSARRNNQKKCSDPSDMLLNGMHQRRQISPRSKIVAGECEVSKYHGAYAKTLKAAQDTLQSKWHDPRQRSLYPETLALFAQTVA